MPYLVVVESEGEGGELHERRGGLCREKLLR
jgi:hypothetical protein